LFSFTLTPAPLQDALYVERTAQGYACIAPRHSDDEETPLNIELLYNAVQNGKIKMNDDKLND
jgi:ABC-2 type transport system ATP-binding protein